MKHTRSLVAALAIMLLATLVVLPSTARAERAAAAPPAFMAELAGPDVEVERTPGHYIVIQRSTGHYLDPGAVTDATGLAHLMFLEPGLLFRVMVEDLEGAERVSLHRVVDTGTGVSNEEVAVLWAGRPSADSFSGRLTGGWLSDRDVEGPLTGEGLDGLLREALAGNLYVVVHTEAWPKGEIGGPALPATQR